MASRVSAYFLVIWGWRLVYEANKLISLFISYGTELHELYH